MRSASPTIRPKSPTMRPESPTMRPESPTALQESDLANRSAWELYLADSKGDPVQRLRLLCLSQGACGFLVLGRMFRDMDHDGRIQLNFRQFVGILRKDGLVITDEEAATVFDHFDTDGHGRINMEEFLVAIRPPVSNYRKMIINKAFEKVDKDTNGIITIADLKHIYNVKTQTRYITGENSENSIRDVFLDNFEQEGVTDGIVTREEFLNYYSAISAAIDNDSYFDLMIRQSYKL